MTTRILIAALAAGLLSACATPASSVSSVEWASRSPTFEEYRDTYPEAAWAREIEGRITLMCIVQPDWRLACRPETENPPGWGFTEAALRLSRFYVVRRDYPGVTVGTYTRLPVRFELAK